MERLLTVTAGLALLAVLFAGCGGGGADHAKVEASLRDYLDTVLPDETGLPLGLGVQACADRPVGGSIPSPPISRNSSWSDRPLTTLCESAKWRGVHTYTRAIGLLDEIKRLLTGAKDDAETHAEGGEPVATPPGGEERETSTNAQMMGSSDDPWSGND
jgi:hypothetical protein